MLGGLEVAKTNDIVKALNQTTQLQPLGPLLAIQLRLVRHGDRLNGKLLGHPGAQHSARDFDDHYERLLQSGGPFDLDHEKIGSGARHFFHRLRSSGATIPCHDWHRSSTGGDALKIVIGGLIALAVIGYVASQWKKFD